MRIFELLVILYLPNLATCQLASCLDGESYHAEGERWVRGGNFLVVCREGQIRVLKCITDSGSVIEVGTEEFIEDGVTYSCLDESTEEEEIEGSGEEDSFVECKDENDMVVDGFLICCIGKKLKGCVDDNGDSLKEGFFTVGTGILKLCNIQKDGLKGRIENKGCFNGTQNDDPNDEQFHVKKYAVWRKGDVDLRCGDQGIYVYRCYVDGKQMYTGSAWMDKQKRFNICK